MGNYQVGNEKVRRPFAKKKQTPKNKYHWVGFFVCLFIFNSVAKRLTNQKLYFISER